MQVLKLIEKKNKVLKILEKKINVNLPQASHDVN